MRCESTKVTDVVISLSDANLKAGLAWHTEFFASFGADPVLAACQFVFARTPHALHDFGCAGVEGQSGRQNHAHRFFGAVCQHDVVADAFAIKVNVGLGGDGDVIDFLGGHGEILGRMS